jgi:hypothetical protein
MMPRRQFLEGGALAAMAVRAAEAAPAKPAAGKGAQEFYELRTIRLRIGPQVKIVNDYLSEVLIPSVTKAGAGPVGVFETMFGPEIPTLHVLIPWPSPAVMAAGHFKLAAEAASPQGAAAQAYFGATSAQPAFARMESSLMIAFESMPKLAPPERKPRIFELRTYESPGEAGHAKKMEMFTRLGETEIFRRVGLTPVFFGKTVIGPRMPNLVYMLTFPDLAAREKAWNTFRSDPDWDKLKKTPGYADADIMSNITDLFVRPTGYSQI